MQQFHKSLLKYYSPGGRHLNNPDEMEKFCESTASGLFNDIFITTYSDDKKAPSNKRTKLQQARLVALLHNLSLLRSEMFTEKIEILHSILRQYESHKIIITINSNQLYFVKLSAPTHNCTLLTY